MTPYYADDWLTLYLGDARAVLAELPAESVHCVVTSPPYWGLRDYGTAAWEGGDPECDHALPRRRTYGPADVKEAVVSQVRPGDPGNLECGRCGARRIDSQLGLEPTPSEYVEAMVGVFREVRRVLRRDGVLWLNMGDSYAGGRHTDDQLAEWSAENARGGAHRVTASRRRDDAPIPRSDRRIAGLKPKDLVGMPWRVAFGLQADGWYLRSDIIWSKPNPMPESVTDRPTKAHEYVLLLTRSPRYFYDADAVREAATYPGGPNSPQSIASPYGQGFSRRALGKKLAVAGDEVRASASARRGRGAGWRRDPAAVAAATKGRNLRTVWSIATEPYPGAHFATFPRKLVEPCIKAGTSERGVCPECGAPWVRETTARPPGVSWNDHAEDSAHGSGGSTGNGRARKAAYLASLEQPRETTAWRPSCAHGGEPVPATCLDPFAGTGTVALVAESLGRRSILVELSEEYARQALERVAQGRREGTGAPVDMPLPAPAGSLWEETA